MRCRNASLNIILYLNIINILIQLSKSITFFSKSLIPLMLAHRKKIMTIHQIVK